MATVTVEAEEPVLEGELVEEETKRPRGRPRNAFKVPKPSDRAKEMMANSFVYRVLTNCVLRNPGEMDAVPIQYLLADSARGNEQTGEAGWIKLMAPDAMVRNLKGEESLKDFYVLLRVPRELADRYWAEERYTESGQDDND